MSKVNEKDMIKKLVDLSINYQLDAASYLIEFLELQIKFCEAEISYLKKKQSIFKFWRKNLNNMKIKSLEDQIKIYYKRINVEIKNIVELKDKQALNQKSI